MNDDIVPKLLESIKNGFDDQLLKSSLIKSKQKLLLDGKATYIDANDYAVEIGEILKKSFEQNTPPTSLPDGRMYFNIAERLLNTTLTDNYKLVSDYATEVQNQLNQASNISVKAQIPSLNQDRIDGLINRISSEENFKEINWILGEPVINFTQNIINDFVSENANFQYKTGLKPKITRKVVGKACKWCQGLSGSYNYPDVPDDIYRRHERCRCMVDYNPGDGKKQNVWTKSWSDANNEKKRDERKKIGIIDTTLPYVSVKKEWLKNYNKNAAVSEKMFWEHSGNRYTVDGKNVVLDYSIKEKEVAKWLTKMLGADVQLVPRVNFPEEIKTPDYLISGMDFDLKEITGSGKNVIDGNVRKAGKQSFNFVFDFSSSKLTNEEIYSQVLRIYNNEYRKEVSNVILKRGDKLIDVINRK